MGCVGGKPKAKKGGAKCDSAEDEKTGLSECDRHAIKESWGQMMGDEEAKLKNGTEFFIQVFTSFPNMQELHPTCKGLELTELGTCQEMKDFVPTVTSGVQELINSIDDPDAVVQHLQANAERCIPVGIGDKDFEDIETAFIPWLRSILGDKCTPETETAWGKLLKKHTSIMKSTLEAQAAAAAEAEPEE